MNKISTLRKAVAEDAEIIMTLANRLFSELYHRPSVGDDESALFCKTILESGEYIAFISEDHQGCANGIIALSQGLSIYAGGKFGVIREFYVVPEMRSIGIGKALLEKAKEFAMRNGWKRIEVTPPDKEKFSRTYNFYIREGFGEIGPRLKLEFPDVKHSSVNKGITTEIKILDADLKDMDEILALQKAAYRSEAEIYNDYSIPPLHQAIDEIQNDFKNQLFLKGIKGNAILGAVRGYEENGTCFIGKLIVDPTYQNKGIGTKLLIEIEKRFTHAQRFELFTGHKSRKNIYLYDKCGYKEFRRKKNSDKLTLIFLEKYNKS